MKTVQVLLIIGTTLVAYAMIGIFEMYYLKAPPVCSCKIELQSAGKTHDTDYQSNSSSEQKTVV